MTQSRHENDCCFGVRPRNDAQALKPHGLLIFITMIMDPEPILLWLVVSHGPPMGPSTRHFLSSSNCSPDSATSLFPPLSVPPFPSLSYLCCTTVSAFNYGASLCIRLQHVQYDQQTAIKGRTLTFSFNLILLPVLL